MGACVPFTLHMMVWLTTLLPPLTYPFVAIAEVDKPVMAVTVTAKPMIITPRPQLREEK